MKKILVFLLIAVMTLSSFAACGGEDSANDNAEELKEVDVVLDWYPNALHAFMYVLLTRAITRKRDSK